MAYSLLDREHGLLSYVRHTMGYLNVSDIPIPIPQKNDLNISVSLDGTKEVNDWLRGSDLEKVENNIKSCE